MSSHIIAEAGENLDLKTLQKPKLFSAGWT